MNKQERIVAIFLGLALVGWMFYSNKQSVERAKHAAKNPQPVAAVTNAPAGGAATLSAPALAASPVVAPVAAVAPVVPSVPEEIVKLNGGEMTLLVSSHGAVIKQVTLNNFLTEPGKAGAKNPPVTLDFANAPGLEIAGLPGLALNAVYRMERDEAGKVVTLSTATAEGLTLTRRIELQTDYQVKVTDTLRNAGANVLTLGTNSVSIGAMRRGTSKNDMLSIDSLPAFDKAKVRFWDKEKATKQYLVGAYNGGFGCGGGKSSSVGMPDRVTVPCLSRNSGWRSSRAFS